MTDQQLTRQQGAELKELSQDFLLCRIRHIWDEVPWDGGALMKWENQPGLEKVQFRCERCTTRAYLLIVRRTGDLFKSDYRYPPGYEMTQGKVLVKFIRREWVSRLNGSRR